MSANRPLSSFRNHQYPDLPDFWPSLPKQAPAPPASPEDGFVGPPPPKPLSNRETECLYWSSAGKTSWETGSILGVSESTVNFHLRNACAKLGVRGRRAAVAAALRQDLFKDFKA